VDRQAKEHQAGAIATLVVLLAVSILVGNGLFILPGLGENGTEVGWFMVALGVVFLVVFLAAIANPLKREGLSAEGITRSYRFSCRTIRWEDLRSPETKVTGKVAILRLPYVDAANGKSKSIPVSSEELGLILNFPRCPKLKLDKWVYRRMKAHGQGEGLKTRWE